jgi:hypothetical protein
MRIAPDLGDASMVLVGSFNPRIFRPDWFARVGLVTEAEAGAANVEIIHPEITVLWMDRLRLRVEPGRLIATTEEAPFMPWRTSWYGLSVSFSVLSRSECWGSTGSYTSAPATRRRRTAEETF